jgi:hypothetical protein
MAVAGQQVFGIRGVGLGKQPRRLCLGHPARGGEELHRAVRGLGLSGRREQSAGGDEKGGVYCYPFSNIFQPIGHGAEDGDLNSANFDRKIGDFIKKYFDAQASPAAAPRS